MSAPMTVSMTAVNQCLRRLLRSNRYTGSQCTRCLCLTSTLKSSTDIPVNHKVELDPQVFRLAGEEGLQHKSHPGIMNIKTVHPPDGIESTVIGLMEKHPNKDLVKHAKAHHNYLWARHLPVEDHDLRQVASVLREQVEKQDGKSTEGLESEELKQLDEQRDFKVKKILRKQLYNWQPVRYNAYKSFLYLVGRFMNDYSALYRIFSEIKKRNPEYNPQTLFDFGSGVGTVTWAANTIWPHHLVEHYCVDPSADMNTIARLLLQGGHEDEEMCFPGVFHKNFMPPSAKNKYSLVTSAFSLLELPNRNERFNTLLSLWRKTEDYLVLVENGTNTGFKILAEARDFLLGVPKIFEANQKLSVEELTGHVFAPCPHELLCPRIKRKDNKPCNFEVKFRPLALSGVRKNNETARFSYLVLKKGDKGEDYASSWPRVVRSPSTPSKQTHCQMCTVKGTLEKSVITASKHGRDLFKCARYTDWGDLLPVTSEEWTQQDNTDTSQSEDTNNMTTQNISQSEDSQNMTTQKFSQSEDSQDVNTDTTIQSEMSTDKISQSLDFKQNTELHTAT